MRVEIGHRSGVEAQEGTEGKTLYAPVEGERTTSFNIPDGTDASEAAASIRDALGYHIQSEGDVAWVRSDNKDLEHLVMAQLGVDRRKNRRPVNWGQGELA